jgi:uncharacterized protein (DUF342 family)
MGSSKNETGSDGAMTIHISSDKLEARADFTPSRGTGRPLTDDYLRAVLARFDLTHGVLWEAVADTARRCNADKKPVKNVLVAKGTPPINEVNDYFAINPHLGQKKAPRPDKNRNYQIDYRENSPFTIVGKDQVLAIRQAHVTGREGKNVHGAAIPFGQRHVDGLGGGKNTKTTDKYIVSLVNGQLLEDGKTLNVLENLAIKGNVGYATGNIIFPGDIEINGAVSDGFKIYSGGSVTIKQTLDATEVVTKGDLTVSGGIVGRGRAYLKVGGGLRAKFIQNCKAACRKTIAVDAAITNSNIFTMENLDMGDKGAILGGEIYAIKGVKAGAIGKEAGRATHIHCGIDFTLQKEQESCNKTLRDLSGKLAKLKAMLTVTSHDPARQAKIEEAVLQLEGEQKKTSSRIAELMGLVHADESAAVEVNGAIAPGTLIEICEVALFVAEPLKHVRIRLDKPGGRIISEPL